MSDKKKFGTRYKFSPVTMLIIRGFSPFVLQQTQNIPTLIRGNGGGGGIWPSSTVPTTFVRDCSLLLLFVVRHYWSWVEIQNGGGSSGVRGFMFNFLERYTCCKTYVFGVIWTISSSLFPFAPVYSNLNRLTYSSIGKRWTSNLKPQLEVCCKRGSRQRSLIANYS